MLIFATAGKQMAALVLTLKLDSIVSSSLRLPTQRKRNSKEIKGYIRTWKSKEINTNQRKSKELQDNYLKSKDIKKSKEITGYQKESKEIKGTQTKLKKIKGNQRRSNESK